MHATFILLVVLRELCDNIMKVGQSINTEGNPADSPWVAGVPQ